MMMWAMRLLCCVVWWSIVSSTSAAEREVHCPKSWPEGSQNTGSVFVIYDHEQTDPPYEVFNHGDQETVPSGTDIVDIVCSYKNHDVIILPLFYKTGLNCSYSYYYPKHKPKKPRPDLKLKYLDAMCKIPDDYQGDLSFSKVARITDQDDLQGIRLGDNKENVRLSLKSKSINVSENKDGHFVAITPEGRGLTVVFDHNNSVSFVLLSTSRKEDRLFMEMKRRFGPPFFMLDYQDGISMHKPQTVIAWQTDHGVTMVVRLDNPDRDDERQMAILSYQPLNIWRDFYWEYSSGGASSSK